MFVKKWRIPFCVADCPGPCGELPASANLSAARLCQFKHKYGSRHKVTYVFFFLPQNLGTSTTRRTTGARLQPQGGQGHDLLTLPDMGQPSFTSGLAMAPCRPVLLFMHPGVPALPGQILVSFAFNDPGNRWPGAHFFLVLATPACFPVVFFY